MRCDWLVSPYMPANIGGEGRGLTANSTVGANCQLRIAFLLMYITTDIMTNEGRTAYFNRSKKEKKQS